MKLLKPFIRDYAPLLLLNLLTPFVFLTVFLLYGFPTWPLAYSVMLYALLCLPAWGCVFIRYRRSSMDRQELARTIMNGDPLFPEKTSLADEDYRRMLQALSDRVYALTDEARRARSETMDYYTLWVHQIKTPIAAMHMLLQAEDTPNHARMEAELFRIEQYAAMALNYVRLEGEGSDLDFRMQPLDRIIRNSIRRFAPLFISRQLQLVYEGSGVMVLTDAKWLSFILEQLLSNAVKYTASGSVRITVSDDLELTVSDTGIGISPEDLPRIFDKGFTGHNGRLSHKSTGLGLYLCGQAARQLGITIHAQSRPGEGSSFTLDLAKDMLTPD